VVKIIGSQVAG